MGRKSTGPWCHIGLRASLSQRAALDAAARSRGVSLNRFLLDAGLKEAGLDHGVGIAHPETPLSRQGPGGYERQGWDLAVRAYFELAHRYSGGEARERHGRLREALESGDRMRVYGWLERCFPEKARGMPPRRQLAFLKGMALAWKQGLVLGGKMPDR